MCFPSMKNKKSQSVCKPGSVLPKEAPAIYLRRMSPSASIVLPSGSDEQPSNASLHELSTPKMCSPHVTTRLVCSYHAFSPLPNLIGGCFLPHYSELTPCFPLGSGMLFVARTFLFHLLSASDKPTNCDFSVRKYCNS